MIERAEIPGDHARRLSEMEDLFVRGQRGQGQGTIPPVTPMGRISFRTAVTAARSWASDNHTLNPMVWWARMYVTPVCRRTQAKEKLQRGANSEKASRREKRGFEQIDYPHPQK